MYESFSYMNDFPVDLVVTYVDSNDLTWKSAVS